MPTRRLLVLGSALTLAACADLLGVEPLSGADAASPVASDSGAADSGASDSGPSDAVAADAGASDAGQASESGGCVITWVDSSGGVPVPGAVPNPVTGSTADLYVCRVAAASLGVIPGKLLPGYACYYGDGQSEVTASSYQVLVPEGCTLAWGPAALGDLPFDAVVCGQSGDGGALYSCRAGPSEAYPGELGHVGWSTNHECVYSLSGASLTATDFDVLTAE